MLSNTNSIGKVKAILMVMFCIGMVQACKDQHSAPAQLPTQREVNRSMEDIVRQMSREEDAEIESYISENGWAMNKTGTGLRYMVYEAGPEGPLARLGQVATVRYEVQLMDGTVAYSSEEDGIRSFLIGQDNVESGIHEAIQYLKVGDRAKVILPSHLAHGLSGDNDKIPPRSTVIYDLELVALK